MTWEHLQKWRSAMQELVRREFAARMPEAGSNVVVQGDTIRILSEQGRGIEPKAAAWDYVVFGRVRPIVDGVTGSWGDWDTAYGVASNGAILETYFWEHTQLISNETITRAFDIELTSRGVADWQRARAVQLAHAAGEANTNPFLFAITSYREPRLLILGEYTLDEENALTVLQREIPILLGSTAVQSTFTPGFSYSELRPIRIERV